MFNQGCICWLRSRCTDGDIYPTSARFAAIHPFLLALIFFVSPSSRRTDAWTQDQLVSICVNHRIIVPLVYVVRRLARSLESPLCGRHAQTGPINLPCADHLSIPVGLHADEVAILSNDERRIPATIQSISNLPHSDDVLTNLRLCGAPLGLDVTSRLRILVRIDRDVAAPGRQQSCDADSDGDFHDDGGPPPAPEFANDSAGPPFGGAPCWLGRVWSMSAKPRRDS